MTKAQPSEARLKLLAKIKALADRGVGGEKINAKSALDRYLREIGIDATDLEAMLIQAERKPRYFAVAKSRKKELQLLWQHVVAMALNDTGWNYTDYIAFGKRTANYKCGWEVAMTGEEYAKALSYWIPLSTNYCLQRKRYLEQQERIFSHAYVNKHGLFPESKKKTDKAQPDLEYLKKVIEAQNEIDRVDIGNHQAKLDQGNGKRLGQGEADTK